MASETVQRWVVGAVATPFAWFLGAGGHPLLAAFSLVAALSLAQVADVDHRLRWVEHEHTHSLLFALGIALVGAVIGWAVADQVALYAGMGATGATPIQPHELGLLGFMIGGQATIGHLLADAVTSSDVHPFWPLTSHGGSCDGLRLLDPRENEGRYVLGTIMLTVVLTVVLLTVI